MLNNIMKGIMTYHNSSEWLLIRPLAIFECDCFNGSDPLCECLIKEGKSQNVPRY